MRKIFTLLVAAVSSVGAWAQLSPLITGWTFNTDGTLAQYTDGGPTQTLDSAYVLQVCYDANKVFVRSNDLPGGGIMGPWSNPNVPAVKQNTFVFPANPTPETGTHVDQPATGAIGLAVDGVHLYGVSSAFAYNASVMPDSLEGNPSSGIWYTDAWVNEGPTMDTGFAGHAQDQGVYHYHATPIKLYTETAPAAPTQHSPIIGFAFDGYPIYGPFGYSDAMNSSSSIARMASGWAVRPDLTPGAPRDSLWDLGALAPPNHGPNVTNGGNWDAGIFIQDYSFQNTGDLDIYNGRDCVTPEYPGGTYAYFLPTDANGDPAFPYLIGLQYYGEVDTMGLGQGVPGLPPGVTCYDPITASEGLIDYDAPGVAPNPASASMNVNFASAPNVVILTSMLGAEVYNASSEGENSITIDVTNLDNGVYVLRGVYQDGISSRRIIISH